MRRSNITTDWRHGRYPMEETVYPLLEEARKINKVYDGDDDIFLPTEVSHSSASQFLDSFWSSKSLPSFQDAVILGTGDSVSDSTNMVNLQNSSPKDAGLEGLIPLMKKHRVEMRTMILAFKSPKRKGDYS
ncbi:hypothetical protein DCAR_0415627 [Daucus carota subsp. sativus]|uniref:Uncharacterized protein n=1 Tax=Daucus carota subsp. sativus TaxID=79200 RepID=A0A162A9G9_DAUCS|nr:hypothetical protein DCAR_0415627 [Daucus carota subsp. sativus]